MRARKNPQAPATPVTVMNPAVAARPSGQLPQLIHAAAIPIAADWAMGAHGHADTHELVMVIKGKVETTVPGRTWICPAGSTKYHPRGMDHAERSCGGPGTLLLLAWKEAPGTDFSRWPLDIPDRGGRFRVVMEWLVELALDGRREAQTTRDALLHALLDEMMTRPLDDADPAVTRALGFAREHLAEPIYLAHMAHAAGMSRFHFARRFRRVTGRSPMEWLRRARIEAARSLLLTTPLPLRAIAPRVGFADEFQLSRVYREITGTTPRGGRTGMQNHPGTRSTDP
jgi:AraC-like DNA-binding protein